MDLAKLMEQQGSREEQVRNLENSLKRVNREEKKDVFKKEQQASTRLA